MSALLVHESEVESGLRGRLVAIPPADGMLPLITDRAVVVGAESNAITLAIVEGARARTAPPLHMDDEHSEGWLETASASGVVLVAYQDVFLAAHIAEDSNAGEHGVVRPFLDSIRAGVLQFAFVRG
ncbi:hypothetical protein ACO0E1_13400 [Curtobacterium sp. RRHDQ66]|uniref:hypothetical protein n=1 Tax=Curtobacterium guangdongense TaxID=3413380 RepID=UPI003BF11763